MILTDEQLKERLLSENNLTNIIHKVSGKGQHKKQARKNPEKSNEERALIGLTAQLGTVKETAESFGVSPASVNAYKQGETSLNPDTRSEESGKDLKALMIKKSDKISESALDKLVESIESINVSDPKKALQLSMLSKNLADVHDKMRPVHERSNGVSVTIFSPRQKHVNDYEVIDINVES